MQNQFFSLSEARRFVALGLPVFVAQMSQMGMNFVDTAMTGQASTADMAAVAVAGSIWNPLSLLGIGCLLSLPAMSAHLVGGGQRSRTPHLLRQGIWLTLVISAILMTAFYVISWHLQSFGLDEELSRLGGGYLRAMLWGLPGFMLFVNVRSFLDGVPLIGPPMKKSLMGAKTLVRRAMYHSTMFEDMGFEYIGPVDGHNVEELERTLRSIYQRPGPHFLHVVTKKGKGYQPAEMNPGNYHGVSAFDPDGMPDPEVAPKESFSTVFGKLLVQEGTQNPKLCAITAAMKYGTGLQFFAHRHPQRFFDVGMAEQHAVTFAAGLASQGMLPVVCIYSTFLQRSYDQIIHDVNLLKENVLFAIDRAGFVPADGETHQGIYDAAFLSQLNIPVYAPSNYEELQYWLHYLLQDTISGPRAIRYPRGGENTKLAQYPCTKREYDFLYETPGAEILLVSYADEVEDVLNAAKLLGAENIPCDVYKLVKIFPFTEELIREIMRYDVVLMAEECVACGGIGEHLEMALQHAGWNGRYIHTAVEQLCLPHATVPQIKQVTGLDAEHLAQAVREAVQAPEAKGEAKV